MESTHWWLALHVLGSVIFPGNTIVTFFWKLMADRSRDARVPAFAQCLVARTGMVFTTDGAAMLAIGGYAHAGQTKLSLVATPVHHRERARRAATA